MSKTQNTIIWVITTLLAAAFISAGVFKLMGVEMMHQSFVNLGLPTWFGYFIGVAEILGGIGLFVKKWSSLAAVGLTIIMLSAIGYHLNFDPLSQAVPAVVLAVLSIVIFVTRRKESILLLVR